MTTLESRFVDALVWKTIILGVAFAVLGWMIFTAQFAAAILLGMLVSAFNLRVVAWVSRKMVRAAQNGQTNTSMWSAVLLVKLFLLFVLTYIFLAVVRADVIGYVIGYSSFLPAIGWQAICALRSQDTSSRTDGDTESL